MTLNPLPTNLELPNTLEGCHDLLRQLWRMVIEVQQLQQRVAVLEAENKALKEQLNRNSSNTSLPPSRDFKKPKSKKPPSANPSGGQPGHRGHHRQLLESHEVDAIVHCSLPTHCECGGELTRKEDYQRHQVYELPPIQLQITEYRLEKGRCRACGRRQTAALPEGVTWGMTGPRLTSLMSHLVSRYRLSRRELQLFLKEQFQFTLSLGSVFNKQKIVTTALATPVAGLLTLVQHSAQVHADETGHRRDGKPQWLWGLFSPTVAFFSIQASRGKKVLKSLLPNFQHTLISDRYAAYNVFDSSQRQLCWAHLKRDFTRLAEKDNPLIAKIGRQLLVGESELFQVWHRFKQGRIDREELLRLAWPLRRRIGELLEQGSYTDPLLKAAGLCKNLLTNFDALWTFLSVEGIEPTNNHAERSLRPAVIWRKSYFGTRSDYGSEFVARSQSVYITCKLQSINAFDFVHQTVQSYFSKTTPPSFSAVAWG
jgi:transposase